MPPIFIRETTTRDEYKVDKIHRHSFEGSGEKIVELVHSLRNTPAKLKPIDLVAVDGDEVVGHAYLSSARLDALHKIVDVLTLSPLAVGSKHRRQGIAAKLILEGLAEANRRDVPLVFIEGDPGYYGSRGFKTAGPMGFRRPSLRIPELAFQVAILDAYQPWMAGTFVYSEPFWAHDCVGLR